MANVSIIVLQYNHSDRTLACLESLQKLQGDFDVIVVDNGSDVEHLKNVEFWIESQKDSRFTLQVSRSNLGYSGGNNIGIKYALEHGAEKVLLLNNDVVLGEIPSEEGDIVGTEMGNALGREYISGAVMLIKREVFEKIGLLDERYFLYYEDLEFCVRAQKAGFQLSGSTAQFTHAVSATTSSLGAATLLYYHTRNALLFYQTHGNAIALLVRKFWITLKQKIKLALGQNVEISQAMLQGVRDFESGRFGVKKHH